MAVLRQYYDVNDDGAPTVKSTQWIAQTFTPAISHTITSVTIKGYRSSAADEAVITLSIRTTGTGGDAGKPSGADLVSATRTRTDFPLSANTGWMEFDLDEGVALTAGTMYAIVMRTDSASHTISWRQDGTGPTYSGGTGATSSNGGVDWSIASSSDQMFREYSGGGAVENIPVDKTYSKQLVAVGNNEVWYESSAGTMAELAAANGDINCNDPLNIFEAYSKAFIVNETNLKIVDLVNVKITTADIQPADKVYPRHGTLITGGTSGAKMVVDYITALDSTCTIYGQRITAATFVNNDVCTATIDEGNVSFTLNAAETAGPHWYDWTVYGQSTTFGALPNKATIGCLYRGRAVISGNSQYPHQWYMMRQANPFDALYGVNDAQSAVAGNNADAGEIGDIVKALIPYKDDYLIFGCANTIWYLTGDPCDGGSINELDLTTGIFGAQSWCLDGEGNLWFWGTNGIYRAAIPGKPICVSEIRLPDLVGAEAVTQSTHRIVLSYDRRRAGIVINITTLSDGINSNYFYDLRTEGFFPESYPEECGVFSAHYYEATDPDYRKLILGGYDGYLRIFDETAKSDVLTDDSVEAIDSYVTFAPIPMSPDPKFTGKLTGLNVVSAGGAASGSQTDSDDIYFEIYVANVAEQVLEKLNAGTNPNISGTISAPGRQRGSSIKRKIKGIYAGIKIGNLTATETWAFEQLLYDMKQSGRFK